MNPIGKARCQILSLSNVPICAQLQKMTTATFTVIFGLAAEKTKRHKLREHSRFLIHKKNYINKKRTFNASTPAYIHHIFF